MAYSEDLHIQNAHVRCRFCLCVVYMLGVLISNVTASMHVVEGVEGGSIILPCSHRSIALEGKPLTVHWRHNDTRNVYDIIHGSVSVMDQHPAYKSRAKVLHENFKRGHVFLKLTDLQLSDRGMYLCFVPDVRIFHCTQLVVKEPPLLEYKTLQLSSHGTEARLGTILHFLISLSGLALHFI